MEIISGTKQFKYNNTAITLGKFDAFHKGHMCLVRQVADSKKEGMIPVLFTFDISPYELVADNNIKYVISRQEKYEICEKSGIDVMIEYPFDNETMNMDAEKFVERILIGQLGAARIIVGKDFHFGKDRKGDVELLKKYKDVFEVIAVDKMCEKGEVISSSAIRQAIADGNIEKANVMLGHELSYSGKIVHGKQLGRKIGAPTINIKVEENRIFPPYGVYGSAVSIDGRTYRGITNIGLNPTVSSDNNIKVETHLIDENVQVYGECAKVNLKTFVRHERKFGDVEELKKQIMADIEKVKAMKM